MLPAYLRPALSSSLPVLYLMSPMSLYGTPVLEAAREYPFSSLTGCPVKVLVAEDLYRNTKEWFALWPEVRRQAQYGVFLDHYNGWVARGTWAESVELMALGRPVWWFNSGEPADRFGFGPPRQGDYAGFHRRVGLGYGRPVLTSRTRPLQGGYSTHRTLRGVLGQPSISAVSRKFRIRASATSAVKSADHFHDICPSNADIRAEPSGGSETRNVLPDPGWNIS